MTRAERAGQILLEAVREEIDSCDALVFSAHRELHQLPLHLFSSPGMPPLGVTHRISYAPNMAIFGNIQKRSYGELAPPLCLSVAALEDSDYVRTCFSTVPTAITSMCGGKLLEGVEASRYQIDHNEPIPSILYLSCHGRYDPLRPTGGELLLSDEETLPSRLTLSNNGALSVGQVLEKITPYAPLVIIDACFSGVQDFVPGDEILGFPAAFLISGSRSVIASNWVVEQNCARAFMTELVTNWVNSKINLGEAMRKAYAALWGSHPHPFHWAAFSLHGDQDLYWEDLYVGTRD
jgi:hypothetical protein